MASPNLSMLGPSRRSMLLTLLGSPSFGAYAGAMDAIFADRPGIGIVLSASTGRVLSGHGLDVADRVLVRPGSTVKPIVLETLRERGADDLKIACPIGLRIGNRKMDCTHPPLNELVDSHRALAYSCNNWFAAASRRLSALDLLDALRRAGFGRAGTLNLAADDDAKRLQALGETGVRVTPLEMTQAYRKLAMKADLRSDLLNAATFGTAQLATPLGTSIAAKTGTTTEGAWIAGWIPADQPKFVVVVYVPAGSGGSDAAPLARELFTSLMEKDPRGVKVQFHASVLNLPFEEYIAGVVAGEAGAMKSMESRKAIAVAARTWAAAFRGRHQTDGFDFCSTTHCQNSRPQGITQASVAAVRATAGEMLWWQGRPALTYYSRDCGGLTEPGEAPYLPQQPDPWCRSKGHNEWRAKLDKIALHANTVRIVERTSSGRVAKIALDKTVTSGQSFRLSIGRQLGWNLVRSDAFDVLDQGYQIEFRGTGAGHGVGLCQTGCAHMGEQGRGYEEILAFYYPGAVLSRFAKGLHWQTFSGEKVRVITTNLERDGPLAHQADRLADEVERRLGLRFRSVPVIRVYPSVAAFRDGAAEPGWVAGSTQGRVIRLQPGVPSGVVRHELFHELVEQHAAPHLPMWFREDLVTYLMGRGGPVRRWVDERGERTVLGWIPKGLPGDINAPAPPMR